jgi:hypothetical protein
MFCQIFVATIQTTTIKILLHLSNKPNSLILPHNVASHKCGKHLTLGVAGNKQTYKLCHVLVHKRKHHYISRYGTRAGQIFLSLTRFIENISNIYIFN